MKLAFHIVFQKSEKIDPFDKRYFHVRSQGILSYFSEILLYLGKASNHYQRLGDLIPIISTIVSDVASARQYVARSIYVVAPEIRNTYLYKIFIFAVPALHVYFHLCIL